MTEEEMRAKVRAAVAEHLAAEFIVQCYDALGFSLAKVEAIARGFIAKYAADVFEKADPATSDMLAGEAEEAVRTLLADVSSLLAKRRSGS